MDELLNDLPSGIQKGGDVFENFEILLNWSGPIPSESIEDSTNDVKENCQISQTSGGESHDTQERKITCSYVPGFGIPIKCVESFSSLEVDQGTDCDGSPTSSNCWEFASEGLCISLHDEGDCRLRTQIFGQMRRDVTEPYSLVLPTTIPLEEDSETNGAWQTCHRTWVQAIGDDWLTALAEVCLTETGEPYNP